MDVQPDFKSNLITGLEQFVYDLDDFVVDYTEWFVTGIAEYKIHILGNKIR